MRRILVTGVGGGVGQGIIKCFQGTPYEVIGTNVDPLGAGLFAVAGGYTVPPASSPDYIPRLRRSPARRSVCCSSRGWTSNCRRWPPGRRPFVTPG